jgi:hypothetical protein
MAVIFGAKLVTLGSQDGVGMEPWTTPPWPEPANFLTPKQPLDVGFIYAASRGRSLGRDEPTAPGEPADTSGSRAWTQDYLAQDASRFFYKWGGHLSGVLIKLRRAFDGDLDQFLIYLVFMLTELARTRAMDEALAKGAERVLSRPRGLNALSIADITRIPRESVRRKLAALGASGHVRRADDGLYYPGPAADLDRFFYDLSPLFWDGVRPG